MGQFGSLLKNHRLRLGKTLREFCKTNGFDAGNYSKIERGIFPPPKEIDKYAEALVLERGGDEWIELFDVANAERGEIPSDLMKDEELVDRLPVLFRTLRATQVSQDENGIEKLIEKIRRS